MNDGLLPDDFLGTGDDGSPGAFYAVTGGKWENRGRHAVASVCPNDLVEEHEWNGGATMERKRR